MAAAVRGACAGHDGLRGEDDALFHGAWLERLAACERHGHVVVRLARHDRDAGDPAHVGRRAAQLHLAPAEDVRDPDEPDLLPGHRGSIGRGQAGGEVVGHALDGGRHELDRETGHVIGRDGRARFLR